MPKTNVATSSSNNSKPRENTHKVKARISTTIKKSPISKKKKSCAIKTKNGVCKNNIFTVKNENYNKCRLHYLISINKHKEHPETFEESAAPVINGLLWIGSITASRNTDLLAKHKIKAIVNASGIEPTPILMKDYNKLGLNYHTFTTYKDGVEKFFIDSPFDKYPDFTKSDFFKYVIQGAKILKNEIEQKPKKPILINCHAGMNRSAAVICAYLILVAKMPYGKCIKLLQDANKTRGLDVLTNPSFRKALKELEGKRDIITI
jgi:hypothetical protein